MEYKRDEPVKVSFTVPDKITVRQQMAYYSEATGVTQRAHFERLWFGARAVIQDWQCDLFKLDVDLDTVTDPNVTEVMLWAAMQVRNHINKLDELPKNS